MSSLPLTPEQAEEAERIYQSLRQVTPLDSARPHRDRSPCKVSPFVTPMWPSTQIGRGCIGGCDSANPAS